MMHSKTFKTAVLFVLLAVTLLGRAADFPSRDIKVIVPWAAGGGTDAIVRKISSLAEKQLPTSMYVQNIAGGMSATGLLRLISARPDGYTVGALTYDSLITIPWQKTVPGYGLDKMKLLARITSEPDAIVVPADSKFKNLSAMVAAAKKKPKSIRVGLQNRGGRTYLALLRLESATGAQFKVITYPGGAAPQKEALLNGEVDFVITSLGDFAPIINSGKAHGLVQFSAKKNKTFPDVPPITQTNVSANLETGSFIVLAVPAGTPDSAAKTLVAAYKKAYNSSAFQKWLGKVGVIPAWLGPSQVTSWAKKTQSQTFDQLNKFKAKGLLSN